MTQQPRPEAIAAADWWAAKLGHATHILGRPDDPSVGTAMIMANAATGLASRTYTDEQRDRFRVAAAERIEAHLQRYTEQWPFEGSWDPAEPFRGAALRTIHVDYGPDPILLDAADQTGIIIGMLDLPMKTVMWVNPGLVEVAEGYGVERVVVWRAAIPPDPEDDQ
jgi:BTG family